MGGTGALGNDGRGVYILAGSQTIVGDTTATSGDANVIAFNGSHGVEVEGAPAIENSIFHNSIHQNGGLGIKNTERREPRTAAAGHHRNEPPAGQIPSGPCFGVTTCVVAVYSGNDDEGMTFEGYTSVAVDGSWSYASAVRGHA